MRRLLLLPALCSCLGQVPPIARKCDLGVSPNGDCRTVVSIAVGQAHACAALSDGSLYCWGSNAFGQLGHAGGGTGRLPTQVPGLPGRTIRVSAGWSFTCALQDSGALYCFGTNALGQSSPADNAVEIDGPPAEPVLRNVKEMASYGGHTLALDTSGSVWTFGDLWDASASRETRQTPVQIPFPQQVASVSASAYRSCVLLIDGSISCWGNTTQPVVVMATALPAPVRFTSISGGDLCVFGISEDGTAYGHDSNCTRACADAPTQDVTPIAFASKVTDIAGGWRHQCLLAKGAVTCWGEGKIGQLGNGVEVDCGAANVPLTNVTALGVGWTTSCGAFENGSALACWGDDHDGEVGDGRTSRDTSPFFSAPFRIKLP